MNVHASHISQQLQVDPKWAHPPDLTSALCKMGTRMSTPVPQSPNQAMIRRSLALLHLLGQACT